MLSDKEKEKIREEARDILGKFASELDKVRVSKSVREKIKNADIDKGYREEGAGEGSCADGDFRELMLSNAPNKNKDSIIAEKKKW